MSIHQIPFPDLAIFSYIIIDPTTKRAAVIDPPREIDALLETIAYENATVVAILETHVHADFISGAKELKSKLGQEALIFSSVEGGPEWIPPYADVFLKDKEHISLGSLRLQARHTPGHTPEHMTFLLFDDHVSSDSPLAAFTGDFLLIGTVGRPDLLGKEKVKQLASALYDSLFNIVPTFPDSLQIFPGHTAGSLCGKGISPKPTATLKEERQSNHLLARLEKKAWIDSLLLDMPEAPKHFSTIKKCNVSHVPLIKDLSRPTSLTLEALMKIPCLLDVRSQAKFANSHIPQSINIPLAMPFTHWAASLLPYNSPIALIVDDEKLVDFIVAKLRVVGLDSIKGYFVFQEHLIAPHQRDFESFSHLSVQEAFKKMHSESDFHIVDVRTLQEWLGGHIENCTHCELSRFAQEIHSLPRHKPLGLICGSGYRSSIGASLLQREGFKNLFNIDGGMMEWQRQNLPTVKPKLLSTP